MRNINLKIARLKASMPQPFLAMKIGISQSKLSQFEMGYRQPSKEEAEKIARALNVKPEEIFGGNNDGSIR